jgi:hypothetical protein
VVDSGVGDDDHSGFLEGLGDVIGEVTGGESTGNGLSTGETSHLEDSSVTVRSSRDDGNVCGVLDGGEDSGSKDELLPGLTDVEDVDTWMLVWKGCIWHVAAAGLSCFLLVSLLTLLLMSVFLDCPVSIQLSCTRSQIPIPPPAAAIHSQNHSPSALRL